MKWNNKSREPRHQYYRETKNSLSGQRNSIAGKARVLHTVSPGSILSTTYGHQNTTRSDP